LRLALTAHVAVTLFVTLSSDEHLAVQQHIFIAGAFDNSKESP
jgi:hypothetical protein